LTFKTVSELVEASTGFGQNPGGRSTARLRRSAHGDMPEVVVDPVRQAFSLAAINFLEAGKNVDAYLYQALW
jgi:hypothetical protein